MRKVRLMGLLVVSVVMISACGTKVDNATPSTTAEETSTEMRISIGNDSEQENSSDKSEDNQIKDSGTHGNNELTPDEKIDNEVQDVYNGKSANETEKSSNDETKPVETSADYSLMDDLASSFGTVADNESLAKALGLKSSDYIHLVYCKGSDDLELGIFKVTAAQKDKVQNSLSAYVSGKAASKVGEVSDYIYFYTSSSADTDLSYMVDELESGLSS